MGQALTQEGLRRLKDKYFSGTSISTTASDSNDASVNGEAVSLSRIQKGEPKMKSVDVQKLHVIPPLTYALLSAAVYKAGSDHPSNNPRSEEKTSSSKIENSNSTNDHKVDQPDYSPSASSGTANWRKGNAFRYSGDESKKVQKEGSQESQAAETGSTPSSDSITSSTSSSLQDFRPGISPSSSVEATCLPKGWEVFLHCKEVELERDGFCAVAYIQLQTRQCIIAFRGTANALGLRAGIWMFFQELSIQFFLAKQFSKVVREKLLLDFGNDEKGISSWESTTVSEGDKVGADEEGVWAQFPAGYHLSYTGHSLGAVLASVRAVDEGISAVTFESPGCFGLIQRLTKQKREQQKVKRMEAEWKKDDERRSGNLPQGLDSSRQSSPSLTSKPDTVGDSGFHQVPSLLASVSEPDMVPQLFYADPPPESLLTNYLQPPNAINTLHSQIGYCVMLPARGCTVEEEVLAVSRHAASLLASTENRLREKQTMAHANDIENEGNHENEEASTSKNSSFRRFVPKFKVGMPTIHMPTQGILRSVLFSSVGMGEVMNILNRLEPHFKELMSRTRQQHSIKAIVEYFVAHEKVEQAPSTTPAVPLAHRTGPLGVQDGLKEVLAWPMNSLQYMEYLNAQRALLEQDVQSNWNLLKAYQSQLKHLFEVVNVEESRDGIRVYRPLRQRYISPSVVCLIDWWACLKAEVKHALSLKASDHAVLNVVHLTGSPSRMIKNPSTILQDSESEEASPNSSIKGNSPFLMWETADRGLYVENGIMSPLDARDVLFRLSRRKYIGHLLQRELHRQSYQFGSRL